MNLRSNIPLYFLLAANSFAEVDREMHYVEKNAVFSSTNEADQLVQTVENNKRDAATALKSALERVHAYYQVETSIGERKILSRRVAAPSKLPTPQTEADAQPVKPLDLSQWSEWKHHHWAGQFNHRRRHAQWRRRPELQARARFVRTWLSGRSV